MKCGTAQYSVFQNCHLTNSLFRSQQQLLHVVHYIHSTCMHTPYERTVLNMIDTQSVLSFAPFQLCSMQTFTKRPSPQARRQARRQPGRRSRHPRTKRRSSPCIRRRTRLTILTIARIVSHAHSTFPKSLHSISCMDFVLMTRIPLQSLAQVEVTLTRRQVVTFDGQCNFLVTKAIRQI